MELTNAPLAPSESVRLILFYFILFYFILFFYNSLAPIANAVRPLPLGLSASAAIMPSYNLIKTCLVPGYG